MSIFVAYAVAICIMILLFLVALTSANHVPYTPGGGDVTRRRVIFWVWCMVAVALGFGVNVLIGFLMIDVPSLMTNYMTASAIAAAISLVLYILVGMLIGFTARGKLQRWPF